MHRGKILLSAIIALAIGISPVNAENISLNEIQESESAHQLTKGMESGFGTDHWIYKSLKSLSEKYGLTLKYDAEKFKSEEPLTRKEAALILLNLTSQIEDTKTELNDSENTRIEILRDEFKKEIALITNRLAAVESTVDSLNGKVEMLEKSDKKSWKYLFAEKMQLGAGLQFDYSGQIKEGANTPPPNFRIPYSELYIKGRVFPHIDYFASYLFSRQFNPSTGLLEGNGLPTTLFMSTDIIPRNKIFFGQTRIPQGYEGMFPIAELDIITRAQISRNFSNYWDKGVRIDGDYGFAQYQLGFYNGAGINRNDTNRDLTFASMFILKPLYNLPQLGDLSLAGGIYTGKQLYGISPNAVEQTTLSFYGKYTLKRYHVWGEYARRDGYLNPGQIANGWYVHNAFDITKRLQLLFRYDDFDSSQRVTNNATREYTLGTNYFFRGNNLKLQVNGVYVDAQFAPDSERIDVRTQIFF